MLQGQEEAGDGRAQVQLVLFDVSEQGSFMPTGSGDRARLRAVKEKVQSALGAEATTDMNLDLGVARVMRNTTKVGGYFELTADIAGADDTAHAAEQLADVINTRWLRRLRRSRGCAALEATQHTSPDGGKKGTTDAT